MNCQHHMMQGAHPTFAPHLTGAQVQCCDCDRIFSESREAWCDAHGMAYEPLVCLNDGPECEGDVEYRMALSGTGQSYPRCEKHWFDRVEFQRDLAMRYPLNPPSDFDPAYAGEVWSEEDY